MKQLVKKIKLTSTMTALTGLHIGGSKDSVEIGGVDLPVIKMATKSGQPYVPGSSLKGKMRCLLEQVNGATRVGQSAAVNNLFGYLGDKQQPSKPSKIIVRDAYLTPKSVQLLKSCSDLDMPFTENKYENSIDRIKGVAANGSLRQIERVPAGVEFKVEIIINVWEDDDADGLLELLYQGISLLKNDYLGGSGSRGYGQVSFSPFTKTELSSANNWKE